MTRIEHAKRRVTALAAFALAAIVLMSCGAPALAPYCLEAISLERYELEGGRDCHILSLRVCNESAVAISTVTLEFNVFSTDDQGPLYEGFVSCAVQVDIAAGANGDLAVELPVSSVYDTAQGCLVDGLCLTRIDYSDGSAWFDHARRFMLTKSFSSEESQ